MSSATALPSGKRPSPEHLQLQFLAVVLPRLMSRAAVCLRDVRCPTERDELLAELLALGWSGFPQLKQLGKEPEHFPTVLARFAGRAVRSGRRLCGRLKAKDVLSPVAQRRHGFVVQPLPGGSSLAGNLFDEALQDNRRSEVPDQVGLGHRTTSFGRRDPAALLPKVRLGPGGHVHLGQIEVTPGPALAGFAGGDDRVARVVGVAGGVLTRRAVAAADVAAAQA